MRAFRAILQIAALLIGQFHACHAVYLLPNGSECRECPVLESTPKPSLGQFAGRLDCRHCCRLATCDKEDASKVAKVASTAQDDLSLTTPCLVFIPTSPPVSTQTHVFRAGVPPTGPPSELRSRAPPSLLA